MSRNRLSRQQARLHPDPRMGRMIFVSLGMHLLVFALFSGILLPRFRRDTRPVYHVDLVNLPVKAPQAGRPDARPEKPKPETRPKKPEPVRTAPPPKPEAVKVAKPKPVKPAVQPKKPDAVKEKAGEKPSAADEKALQEKLRQMRARREIEEYKERISELAAKDTRQAAIPNAPVGMPEGKGTAAGIAWDLWIQTFLKSNWSLSKYQVSRLDLQAKVRIVYDAGGNLLDYRFLDPSGDSTFDDSVKRAILKEKKLPRKPEERLDIEVIFNLKDLLE